MAGLIVIHEFGHVLVGAIIGIPKSRMLIKFINKKREDGLARSILFFISPHVVLLDNNNREVSPSTNEIGKYV
jgi:hypothetical protein